MPSEALVLAMMNSWKPGCEVWITAPSLFTYQRVSAVAEKYAVA